MSSISKSILVVTVLFLAVPVTGILCLNFYLRSSGTQVQLKEMVSKAAGMPVTMQSSCVLPLPPLGAIRLSGITGGQEGRSPFFSADSITLRPDYSELLQGRFVISRLVLNHPLVRLGLGELPTVQQSTKASTSSLGSSTNVVSPKAPQGNITSISLEAISTIQPSSIPPATSQIIPSVASDIPLSHIAIKNGEFTLIDGRGLPLVSASGIFLQAARDESSGWIANLKSSHLVLNNCLIIKNLQTPIRLSKDLKMLSLETFTATLGEGGLTGSSTFDLSLGAPRYNLSMTLAGASLKQLLADASYGPSSAEGTVAGELLLSGSAGDGSSIQGKGRLLATDATIQPVDFLKQIGQLLNIDELKVLRLSESKCLFHLNSGRVVVDDLFLRSENLILSAKGPLKSSGELDLDSRLLFNEKLTGRLRGLLGSQLTPAPEQGYNQIAFHISGSPMSPKTDLLERLTGIKIGGDLGGILQGLFGRPSTPPQTPPATSSPR